MAPTNPPTQLPPSTATTHDHLTNLTPNHPTDTPPTTPAVINNTPHTQPFMQTPTHPTQESHQQQLTMDTSNEPWGNMWVFQRPITAFCIVSKNTGTINLLNLDMQAITQELLHLDARIFAAQEKNVHWDTATNYQLYQQCKRIAPQNKLTTATSQEPAADWYKPSGTLLLTLNTWTSHVIHHGSDSSLGHWSYQELLGKTTDE